MGMHGLHHSQGEMAEACVFKKIGSFWAYLTHVLLPLSLSRSLKLKATNTGFVVVCYTSLISFLSWLLIIILVYPPRVVYVPSTDSLSANGSSHHPQNEAQGATRSGTY